VAAAAAATWRAGEGSFEVQLLNLRNPGGYEARYFRRGGAPPADAQAPAGDLSVTEQAFCPRGHCGQDSVFFLVASSNRVLLHEHEPTQVCPGPWSRYSPSPVVKLPPAAPRSSTERGDAVSKGTAAPRCAPTRPLPRPPSAPRAAPSLMPPTPPPRAPDPPRPHRRPYRDARALDLGGVPAAPPRWAAPRLRQRLVRGRRARPRLQVPAPPARPRRAAAGGGAAQARCGRAGTSTRLCRCTAPLRGATCAVRLRTKRACAHLWTPGTSTMRSSQGSRRARRAPAPPAPHAPPVAVHPS